MSNCDIIKKRFARYVLIFAAFLCSVKADANLLYLDNGGWRLKTGDVTWCVPESFSFREFSNNKGSFSEWQSGIQIGLIVHLDHGQVDVPLVDEEFNLLGKGEFDKGVYEYFSYPSENLAGIYLLLVRLESGAALRYVNLRYEVNDLLTAFNELFVSHLCAEG